MQLPKRKPGKYAFQKNDPMMSQAKFDELEKKYDRLKKKRPQVAMEVARLAELGDFSENVEYQLAKRRLRGINNALLRIEYQINQAVIIKPKQNNSIEIGHQVTVNMAGKEKTYQIMGSAETDPTKGIISHNSPIGSALLGAKIGDVVEIVIGGKSVGCEVLEIK